MSIGKWLEMKGFEVKPSTAPKVPGGPAAAAASASPALPAAPSVDREKEPKEFKVAIKEDRDKDKALAVSFEPWKDVQKEDFKPIQASMQLVQSSTVQCIYSELGRCVWSSGCNCQRLSTRHVQWSLSLRGVNATCQAAQHMLVCTCIDSA